MTSGLPPLPLTVNGYVPRGVEELTVTVSVDDVVAGFGLKFQLVPVGSPLTTEKEIGELKPPVGTIVTV